MIYDKALSLVYYYTPSEYVYIRWQERTVFGDFLKALEKRKWSHTLIAIACIPI
jgi:hypothetical protein